MSISDETLIAYVDGEADAATRTAVEAEAAADPAFAQRLAQHLALRRRMGAAFAGVMDEPVPKSLVDRIADDGKIVSLAQRGGQRASWVVWAGAAAAVGLMSFWFFAGGTNFRATSPDAIASGPLRSALDSQLASADQTGLPVRIGVSFKSADGSYCRTYIQNADGRAGLACHNNNGWREIVAVATDSRDTTYRTAAALPPQVARTLDALISGEPLDAKGERAARARGWR